MGGAALALLPPLLAGLPFYGAKNLVPSLIDKYITTASGYQYATINAFNWFAALGGNWQALDACPVFNLSWKVLGIFNIAVITVLLVVLAVISWRAGRFSPLLLAAFYTVGIFTFAHCMHERYLVLGMLLEAVYYSQVNKGAIDDNLLRWLRDLVEHCTACGRCLANCPVKIPSGEVALTLRSLLEHENAGGHPIKKRALEWLVHDVSSRVPKAAKMASLGQKVQNKLLGVVPSVWKKRMQSPIFAGSGPKMGYTNLYESLRLHRGSVFAPREVTPGMPCVLYFPGCGGSLFYDRIGLAAIMLLLHTGHAVAVPPRHLCCGYPLLAAGMDTEYEDNMAQNRQYLASMLRNLIKQGFDVRYLATACGSCRDSLARMKLNEQFPQLEQKDVSQIVLPLLQHEGMEAPVAPGTNVLYHAACHCEWAGVPTLKGQAQLTGALEQLCKVKVSTIPGCCGESGMGAVTSPTIYNLLRARKKERLAQAFEPQPQTGACYAGPILVGCPSCKIGIARCLIQLKEKHPVLHVLEWLANQVDGEDRRQRFRRRANETRGDVRIVQC